MNQARTAHLISRLNFKLTPRRKMKNMEGPEGRLKMMRKTVTKLIKYERLDMYWNRADEARGYAESLISYTLRHGIQSKDVMEMANYWILEKQLIYKLFNVLVPRFQNYTNACYTNLIFIPRDYPGIYYKKAILELKGNPFPKVNSFAVSEQSLLQNQLLNEARKDYYYSKENKKNVGNIS